jgi:hypothetical protein
LNPGNRSSAVKLLKSPLFKREGIACREDSAKILCTSFLRTIPPFGERFKMLQREQQEARRAQLGSFKAALTPQEQKRDPRKHRHSRRDRGTEKNGSKKSRKGKKEKGGEEDSKGEDSTDSSVGTMPSPGRRRDEEKEVTGEKETVSAGEVETPPPVPPVEENIICKLSLSTDETKRKLVIIPRSSLISDLISILNERKSFDKKAIGVLVEGFEVDGVEEVVNLCKIPKEFTASVVVE